MNNYTALTSLHKGELAYILDQIYLTGLNTGIFVAGLADHDPRKMSLMEEFPYGEEWLSAEAEPAFTASEGEEADLLDALIAAIHRMINQ